MACGSRPSELVPGHGGHPSGRDGGLSRRRGLLRRVCDAVFESRQKQAERVAAAYLQGTGGRFTDEIERRLVDRLVSGDRRR